MNTVTQLPSDQNLMIEPLRPSGLANAAQHRLPGYWHGYLGPGKITALVGVRGG